MFVYSFIHSFINISSHKFIHLPKHESLTFSKRTPAVTLKSSSYFKLFPSSLTQLNTMFQNPGLLPSPGGNLSDGPLRKSYP